MPPANNEDAMLMRILICEDESPMVELLTRFLDPISSRIDSTGDLHTALEMARNTEYNVVILDLRLTRTGKDEALAAIHEFKHQNTEVVVVSGLSDPNLREDALAAGASSFVPKDGDFGARAMLLATNVATLKLPAGSYRSDSYLQHVEMLHKMVHDGQPIG